MARGRQAGDGRGRLGGRAKGTPNKVTSDIRTWLKAVVDGNREQFIKDLNAVEPAERLKVVVSLLPYITPKVVAVDEMQLITAEYDQLKDLLEVAPAKVVQMIIKRIKVLKDEQGNINQ